MEKKDCFSALDGACPPIEESDSNVVTLPQESPPKKGNHSSLIDDLNVGELIDEIMELKEGS